MTEPRLSKAELKRRLERLSRDYENAKTRLAEVGFICEGSLAELYTSCGNPNCRCANPDQRHGPYWQLTWKEYGKTVTRRLSAEDAALYREWIANRRQLEAVLEQMRDLSHQAGEYMLAAKGRAFHGPDRPRSRRPPKSNNDGVPTRPDRDEAVLVRQSAEVVAVVPLAALALSKTGELVRSPRD